jgi:serine/threonine protein kinase
VKEVELDHAPDHKDKSVARLTSELDICRSLQHPNIVSHLGHEVIAGSISIFMELVEGGSIAGVLRDFGALRRQPLRKAAQGALDGLDYLHTRSPPVVHRDVKGANLLVDLDFNVKITDFGCSKQAIATQSFTAVGSIPWMAPEVILQQDGHGRKADIWSFGCTVLEMMTAETPWGSGTFDNMMCALRRIGMTDSLPTIPAEVPQLCREFVELCVRRDADSRPTAKEALEHRFFSCLELRPEEVACDHLGAAGRDWL